MMNKKISILLADDHAVLRSGLKHVLMTEKRFNIIGEAEDGSMAVSMTSELQPDLIIMDINMPKINGIDAVRAIRKNNDKVKILMLTMHDDETYILDAISTGIDGYILKNAEMDAIIDAVNIISAGGTYFPEVISRALMSDYLKKKNYENSGITENKPGTEELTKREREIVGLIASGLTSHEIAARLFISYFTVCQHRKNILQKLHLKNSAELTSYAIRNNIK